jgi:hypothetical protein
MSNCLEEKLGGCDCKNALGVNQSSAGTIARKIIENIHSKPAYFSMFFNWDTIVGRHYSSISYPYKVISNGISERILLLKCKRGLAIEVQHESPIILDMIHNYLGHVFFSQLKVIQSDTNEIYRY